MVTAISHPLLSLVPPFMAQSTVAVGLVSIHKQTSIQTKFNKFYYPLAFCVLGSFGYLTGIPNTINLLSASLLTGVVYYLHPLPNATFDWSSKTKTELQNVIEAINQKYQNLENNQLPPAGYQLNLFQNGKPFSIKPVGQRKKGVPLQGSPTKHPDNCALCSTKFKSLSPKFKLVQSNSNRPLIIDTAPPTLNWFQMTPENQLDMLIQAQKINQMLKTFLKDEHFYLEFHCGSPGGQTQWHTHLRIERNGLWNGISWWDQIQAS